MLSQIDQKRAELFKTLDRYKLSVQEFENYAEPKRLTDYLAKLTALKEDMGKSDEECSILHNQEQLLGLSQSDFSLLPQCKVRKYIDKKFLKFAHVTSSHSIYWSPMNSCGL
jgi:hypothetical protein